MLSIVADRTVSMRVLVIPSPCLAIVDVTLARAMLKRAAGLDVVILRASKESVPKESKGLSIPLVHSADSYCGRSKAALRLKKLSGRNSNSCQTVGITGQSSACGT